MFKYFIFYSLIVSTYSIGIKDDVIDLTNFNPNEFQEELDKYDLALVNFFFPWCYYAKEFAPEYSEAATILKSTKNPPSVPLFKVACTTENSRDISNQVCKEYEINISPDVKLFRSGEFLANYNLLREDEANNIVQFIKSYSYSTEEIE